MEFHLVRGRRLRPHRGTLTLVMSLLILVPVYLLAGRFLVNSHVLAEGPEKLTDNQFKSVLAFIGTALTATTALIGLLLTSSHNSRATRQVSLETVVKSLELLKTDTGGYSSKAGVGGALAALVQLDQPIIAMRTLDAAWDDDAVHPSAASWLISEVLRRRFDNQSVIEAASLLRANANKLAQDRPGHFYWPTALSAEWPRRYPRQAKVDMMIAAARLLLEKPVAWWREDLGRFVMMFDSAQSRERDLVLRRTAALLLSPILAIYDADPDLSLAGVAQAFPTTEQMRHRMASIGGGDVVGDAALINPALARWASGET